MVRPQCRDDGVDDAARMGEAVEETGKREEADLCDAAPLLAQRVLKRLPKTDDRVFPAFEPKVYVIRKLVLAGGPDGDFHRWRHTIATWLQGQGYSEEDCGVVLNHAHAGTATAGYCHGYPIARKRELLDKWAKYIERVSRRSTA